MTELPWNSGIIESIAEGRNDFLTQIFLFFTFLGGQEGYILIIVGLYWLYNKELAYRLAFVVLGSTIINNTLKSIIQNPRPFVAEETYIENWAVSEEMAEELALGYSTPSGHVMSSGSFWSYFFSQRKNTIFRIVCIGMILMISLSRPYLGVHYFEDVIIGAFLGIFVTFVVLKYMSGIFTEWNSFSRNVQNLLIIGVSLVIIFTAGLISDFEFLGSEFATFLGFLSGSVVGNNYEQKHIDFDVTIDFSSAGKGIGIALIRYIIGAVLVLTVLVGLDSIFESIAEDFSAEGYILRFIRYFAVALVALLIVPMIFVKTKLASQNPLKD